MHTNVLRKEYNCIPRFVKAQVSMRAASAGLTSFSVFQAAKIFYSLPMTGDKIGGVFFTAVLLFILFR